MRALRDACAEVAAQAHFVRIEHDAIPAYARSLPLPDGRAAGDRAEPLSDADRERLAAFWITLDAINFGSGWFPTLRKRAGQSGYGTIAAGVTERFERLGPWTPHELAQIDAAEIAATVGQDPAHELMALFAGSLRDLGSRVVSDHAGRFLGVVEAAGGSAVALATRLGGWSSFADSSRYGELEVPFLKRAQIVAADLDRAGLGTFRDLDRLTMFADNLVPHVLRLDGILRFDDGLVRRIEREELIVHDSREEIEIRACALHAVELIVAARPGTCAAVVDQVLWTRGGEPRYKAVPRHRSRCTAY